MQVPEVFDISLSPFCLMRAGIKFPPIEEGWQLPGHGHTYQEALAHKGNVGFIAGSTMGEDVITIGLDQDKPELFQDLDIPNTTTWETRPGRLGMLFTCSGGLTDLRAEYNKKPDLAQFKFYEDGVGVGELKLERCYQVIPNSWKYLDPEDGGQRVNYKITDTRSPAHIDVYALMHSIMDIPGISLKMKPKPVKPVSVAPIVEKAVYRPVGNSQPPSTQYALAALLTELGATERAQPGSRFDQVFKSACALGEFIGAGLLPEVPTFNSLIEAAQNAGLTTGEAIKSATNGIAKGKMNPRRSA